MLEDRTSGKQLADLVTLFGEVQTIPTSNTVLDRLKAIATAVDGISLGGGLTDTQLRATPVPVSGTVTANLSATDNAVLDVIAAKDFATQTTLAALNAKLVTGTVIGDVNLGATDNAVLDAIAADVLATKKATIGATAPTIDSYTHLAINLAAGADQSLVAAPGASKQIWVYGLALAVNADGTVSFQDEDNTAISGVMPLTAGISVPCSGNFAMPIWKVATNKALEVDVVTSELDGWLDYAIVSV